MRNNKVKLSFKVILLFLLFALILYLVFWFFQVVMISVFYRSTKIEKTEEIVNLIETTIENNPSAEKSFNNPSTHETLVDTISNYESDAWVFLKRSNSTNLEVIFSTSSFNEELDSDRFVNLYNNYYSKGKYSNTETEDDLYTLVSFSEDNHGDSVMTVVDSRLVPFVASSNLMSTQFLVINFVIIILSIIFTAVMYSQIVKPITSLTKSARELAKGNYDTEFIGEGFEEIEELSSTLNYAKEELSKLDQYQKDIMANVSHDLRTPLTLITGYGEMLKDYPEERTNENLEIIVEETKRLTRLVNDILLLSNIETNSIQLELEVYSITDAINEIVYRVQKFIGDSEIDISFEYDDNICIYANQSNINQVIYNFISNAINYIGEDKKVIVRQTVEDDYVKITVIDHGLGIPEDQIKNVWYRYYKVKTHKRATIGSGLGLSIVRGILEKHQFEYGVESVVDEGSEFWFKVKIVK